MNECMNEWIINGNLCWHLQRMAGDSDSELANVLLQNVLLGIQ